MINNETAKMTYTTIEGVSTYAIGFSYAKNPDGTPQIKVYLNKISTMPLVYGVDYTLSEDGLNIILASVTSGDRLDIIRDIPLVQLSDYMIGRIDPEQIENDFDKTVMRDQQIQARIDFVGEVPEDHEARIQECETDIDDIESLIPNQTTSENQLADKDFVNSSISTSTATFRGTYSTLADLEAVTADDNDYGFVESVDAVGNTLYSRYKYSNNAWVFEYNLNNSSFTAEQWAAINSGITAGIVNTFNATGHNVGDIFLTMRNDNELNGAVECDGATYNTTDFTGGQGIGQLLADGKVPYVSMAVYASTVAAQGWCDKFGWNGTGNIQFKVPTLNAYIWQKLQLAIKGSVGSGGGGTYFVATDSSFTQQTYPGSGGYIVSVTNNQTIPGTSVDITSEDISQQRCMVQLAISATDEALETCTAVTAQVAANTAAIAGADYVVESQLPTAQNNYTWYRKYKSGWVEQGGQVLSLAMGQATSTVLFPQAFTDTNYTLTFGTFGNGYSSGEANFRCTAYSETSATFYNNSGSVTTYKWYACGMAA